MTGCVGCLGGGVGVDTAVETWSDLFIRLKDGMSYDRSEYLLMFPTCDRKPTRPLSVVHSLQY